MKLVIALVLAATLPLVLLLTSCSQSVAKYEPCGKPACCAELTVGMLEDYGLLFCFS